MRPTSFRPLTVESFEGRVLPSAVAPPRPHPPEPAAHFAELREQRLAEIPPPRFQLREIEHPAPPPHVVRQAIEKEHAARPERPEMPTPIPVPAPPIVGTHGQNLAARSDGNQERLLAALSPALAAPPAIIGATDRAASGLPVPDVRSPGFLRFSQNPPATLLAGDNIQSGVAEVLNRIELAPGTVPQSVTLRSGPALLPGPILRAIEQFRNGTGPVAPMRVAWESEAATQPPSPSGTTESASHSEPAPTPNEVPGSLLRTVSGAIPLAMVFVTTNLASTDVGEFAPTTTDDGLRTSPTPDAGVTRVSNAIPSQHATTPFTEAGEADSESWMLPLHGVPVLGEWAADLVGIQADCETLLTTLVDLANPTTDDGTSTESWLWATGLALVATGMAYGSGLRPVRRAIPGAVPGWDSTSIRLNGTDHA